jgi:DNA-binding NtrC family response regulator
VILCPGDRIGEEQLPLEFFPAAPAISSDASFVGEMETARSEGDATEEGAPTSLHEIGHAHIRMVLQKMKGNKTKAAEALGISRQTLRSRLASLR